MNCRVCNNLTSKVKTFTKVPKHVSVLNPSPYTHEGLNIDLHKCDHCNHYQIEYINDETYYDEYSMITAINNADISSVNPFMERQIKELYNISDNTQSFIEIGCGNGAFLNYAKKYYDNVTGNEPSKVYAEMTRKLGFDCIEEYITPTFQHSCTYDSFCTKQVFEHLPDPKGTLSKIYEMLNENGTGFIEVPNGAKTLYNNRYFDIFTDHVNYFTPSSLTKLVEQCGFTVLKTQEVFNGDYIECYFKKITPKYYDINQRKNFDTSFILKIAKNYNNIGMYGAGAKGYVLATNIGKKIDIKTIFDDDPNKNNRYLPNIDNKISLPQKSLIKSLDLIIISAASYEEKIINKLRNQYNFKGDIIIMQNNIGLLKGNNGF